MAIDEENMDMISEAAFFGEEERTEQVSAFDLSKQVYFDIISLFNETCVKLKQEDMVDCNQLLEYIKQISSLLKQDERMLMGLANTPYSYIQHQIGEQPYSAIVVHGVNLTIYSMKILIDLGVPDNRLPYLGVAALCSRLGLLDASDEDLKAYLGQNEKNEIMDKLENNSAKYINKINIDNFHNDSIKSLISIVKEEQQFLSRTSLNETIHQYAMVIHICEEFEKLTHQKAYGEVFAPIDAMKKMRNEMKDYFNQDIIKFFFNKLSIYPLGSYVKLSSGETAKIVKINENFIMRPTVMIVLDSEGCEKATPVKINLRDRPTLYIKKAVVNEFLSDKFIMLF